jgi:putative photosynthetic complex assembly protein 2
MTEYALALLVALTGWWFSTGLVLWLVHRSERHHRSIFAVATVMMLCSFVLVARVAEQLSPAAAVLAFCLALLLWGWLEMSYLMGCVTGPHTEAGPEDVGVVGRLGRGLGTSLWHELVLLTMVSLLYAISVDQPNQITLWAFSVLWLMRWSAKLNLVLGVRNYNREWLPMHLAYLDSYIPRRPFNMLFPLSLAFGSALTYVLLHTSYMATDLSVVVGLTLVGMLAALGTLEHLFLMLPLGDSALWHWAAPMAEKD